MPLKNLETSKTKKIEAMIKEFGRKHSQIERIVSGTILGNIKGYAFLVPGSYNRKLEDDVSMLSLRIMHDYNENVMMIVWPYKKFEFDSVVYEKE